MIKILEALGEHEIRLDGVAEDGLDRHDVHRSVRRGAQGIGSSAKRAATTCEAQIRCGAIQSCSESISVIECVGSIGMTERAGQLLEQLSRQDQADMRREDDTSLEE